MNKCKYFGIFLSALSITYPYVRYEGMFVNGNQEEYGKKIFYHNVSDIQDGIWLDENCTGPKCIEKK